LVKNSSIFFHFQKPICGHPKYNYIRECALQGFYDGKKVEESEVVTGDDHAKSMEEYFLF
jgi:hypothetical protein